jgi:NADH:ubiquinone oxidoreductase subunit 5 (subunit L)/multisubunit Na+/H+ antiporter MnhA subunit
MFDKPTPVSARIAATVIYLVIRMGEIIDWWFPVKKPYVG